MDQDLAALPCGVAGGVSPAVRRSAAKMIVASRKVLRKSTLDGILAGWVTLAASGFLATSLQATIELA
jgi:hypothetical protein